MSKKFSTAKPTNGLYAKNDVHIYELLKDELYEVKADGTIWTLRTRQGHVGTIWREVAIKIRQSYKFISYGSRTARYNLTLHRIIYAKFKGPLDANLVINHIDGNPSNNHPENLELVSQSENNRHRYKVLGHKASKHNRRVTDQQVMRIRIRKLAGESLKQLAEHFGISKTAVYYIVNNKTFKDVS